jgi:hypothetical protein
MLPHARIGRLGAPVITLFAEGCAAPRKSGISARLGRRASCLLIDGSTNEKSDLPPSDGFGIHLTRAKGTAKGLTEMLR